MVSQFSPNSYDEIPYQGNSYLFTHPNNLATIATLLNLSPEPVQHCRVLELGCANGGNLVPMAVELPDSQFTGIDLSSVQIMMGQKTIQALGLKNITVKQMNILDINPDFGQFDYIIVHGIFSWVPDSVKNKILSICNQNLTSNGVAFISYNTYPGWRLLGIARDMMLYSTRNIAEPQKRITQARAIIDFMNASQGAIKKGHNDPLYKVYAELLKREKRHLDNNTDSYLFHEELEDFNEPLHFYQFAELAAKHGLQYLSEADLSDVFLNEFPAKIRDSLLDKSSDIIELEQYMDFLKHRAFRKTLLVHKELTISRQIKPDRISSLYVRSPNRPASPDPNIHSKLKETFVNDMGIKLTTNHPVTKAAMQCLSEIWPCAVQVNELLEMSYARLNSTTNNRVKPGKLDSETRQQDSLWLRNNLLKGFISKGPLIELRVWVPRFSAVLSDHPVGSPWAQYEANARGSSFGKTPLRERNTLFAITNMYHERIEISEIAQYALSQLDGSVSRQDLLDNLIKLVHEGKLTMSTLEGDSLTAGQQPAQKQQLNGTEQVIASLTKELDDTLFWLAYFALLVA